MESVEELKEISGVYVVRLRRHADERGQFVETYRRSWIAGAPEMVQANRSESKAGTIRGMHYHLFQSDYWHLGSGRVLAGLYDFRESSPTYQAVATLELDQDLGLFVPPGVAHGFYAETDATLTYLVDQYYDGTDELGFRYDDPELGIQWPATDPVLSERDRAAPSLADIPAENRPA